MIKGGFLHRYGDSRQENPAIVIQNIRVGDLVGNVFPEYFDGLIDTGADKSVVPLRICTNLQLKIRDRFRVSGFDGEIKLCPTYLVYLKVKGIGDIPLQVFSVHRKSILLGRDFLKNMLLVMDSRSSKYGFGKSTYWRTLCLKLQGLL